MVKTPVRLAVIASHFIQYQAPLWRALAARPELEFKVYYLSDHGRRVALDPQFGHVFQWDIPLDTGYDWELLPGATGTAPHSRPWRMNFEPTRLVLQNAADVFLRNDYDSAGSLAFFYAALIRRIPVLYRGETTLRHETPSRKWLKRVILRPVFSRRVYALAIGELAYTYSQSLGVPIERISFSRYNVDTTYWERAAQEQLPNHSELLGRFGLPEDRPVVLFCGKIIKIKRPLDLAEAMCRLTEQRPVSLLVVGTGEQFTEMKAIVDKCPKLVTHFAGFVNQMEMPQIYAAADILSLPSSTETWGLVVNEAMYSGCVPVTSEQVGCAPDLVVGVGEVHPVGDVDALVSSLNRVLDELPQRKALIPERIAQYSLTQAADAIVETALKAVRAQPSGAK